MAEKRPKRAFAGRFNCLGKSDMPWRSAENFEKWNDFVRRNGPRSGAFLSSWEWGEFQKAVGKKVRRELFEESGEQKVVAVCLQSALLFGWRAWYCPRGPISSVGYTPELFRSLAMRLGVSLFLRVEPPFEEHADSASLSIIGRSFLRSFEIQPSHTILLSLEQTKDSLFSAMHPKTRYNIHVAERRGVMTETFSVEKDGQEAITRAFRETWPLFKTTGARRDFHLHEKSYYERMLISLRGDCRAELWIARLEREVVAAMISIDFGKTRTYVHGASGEKHRNAMAPFLLHWSAIMDAKEKGLAWYDWWGVAPEGASTSHPWAGITRFKVGFGGARVTYPGTFDFALKSLAYRLYKCLRSIRRIV